MLKLTRLGILGVAILFSACGSLAAGDGSPRAAIDLPRASTACLTAGLALANQYDPKTQLIASFDSNAGDVAYWQENRSGPDGPRPRSSFATKPATEFVAACYFDGVFPGFPQGPPGPTPRPPYDRLLILVGADGSSVLMSAGWGTRLPAVAPMKRP